MSSFLARESPTSLTLPVTVALLVAKAAPPLEDELLPPQPTRARLSIPNSAGKIRLLSRRKCWVDVVVSV
jgi:hypothetical protein